MRGEFIAIGDELLLGDTVNSNAATVGAFLAQHGVRVRFSIAVGDRHEDIVSSLRLAASRAEVVVCSGGLGPTQDDLTREALSAATGCRLLRDPEIEAWLRERFARWGRELPEANLKQADVPAGAKVIWPVGTAPGVILEHESVLFVLLPGPPEELRGMLDELVPSLAARTSSRIETRTVRVSGVPESAVADRLADLWVERPDGVDMSYLAGRGLVRVRFCGDASDAAVRAHLERLVQEVQARFEGSVMSAETLEADLGQRLVARGWRLGVAESLTGGGLGSRLTGVDGASAWFAGGVIAYSDAVKRSQLGVPDALLRSQGAISGGCAEAMAFGVRARLEVQLGIALTGVAGPDPQEGREPGTVFVAVASPSRVEHRELMARGDRVQVRARAVAAAIEFARSCLDDLP